MTARLALITAASVLSTICGSTQAAVLTATVSSTDLVVGEGQSNITLGYKVNTVGPVGITGSFANNERQHANMVLGFTLPTLPTGDVIESVTISFRIESAREEGIPLPNLDTWLLKTATPETTGTALFLEADSDPNPDNKFVSQVGEAQTGDISSSNQTFAAPAFAVTRTLAGDALTLFTSFYTGSSPTQSEAFFRLNLDANKGITSTIERWVLDLTADSSAGFDVPQLSITTVPEPASLALMGLGGLLILSRQRKLTR